MGPDQLLRCCLDKAGAAEDFPFGEQVSVFKVAGKVFAIADLDGARWRSASSAIPTWPKRYGPNTAVSDPVTTSTSGTGTR